MREHGSVLGDVLGRHSKLVLCQAGTLTRKPTKAGTGLLPVRRFGAKARQNFQPLPCAFLGWKQSGQTRVPLARSRPLAAR
jgi:hypothetical protein